MAAQAGSGYTRAGRGGAGNFYDSTTLPDAKDREDAAEKTRLAVNASINKPKAGHAGRGGAGNWAPTTTEHDEGERKRREDLEAKILQDVELGLPMPPKTYQTHDRNVT